MPATTKRNEFASLLEEAINASPKTQNDIASAIGYNNANIITFFKKGNTRVPLEKVVPLAQAIDLDPSFLMRKWFETYMPEAAPFITEYFGVSLTYPEKTWINNLRTTFGTVPAFEKGWTNGVKEVVASH